MTSIIILAIVMVIIYAWYITIVKRKNQTLEALSGIDIQLTKRYELIPNILKIAKKFMEHELNLITEVTALREKIPENYSHNNKDDISNYFNLHNQMNDKMENLLMKMENYPDIKSDQTMLQAQLTYNEVEENISAARRFYNSAVTELNNSIQIFPGNLIAKLANAEVLPFFSSSEKSKEAVDASKFM